MTINLEDRPAGFHWLCEDRRRNMLDRRADERAERQRRLADRVYADERAHSVFWMTAQERNTLSEQETTADKLRQSGMVVR